MIKTIIFDFGNVFINIDIDGAKKNALENFKITAFPDDILAFNSLYEQGFISTEEFLDFYAENFPKLSKDTLKDIWNFILNDFPEHRFHFLKTLKERSKYKLILLSNTNDLHIKKVMENISFFEDFKNCFDAFYLSYEINLMKPNKNIFDFVLTENNLKVNECLFIDDNTDNTNAAKNLGIHIWNIDPKTEDVVTLFETKSNLF